MLSYPVAGLGCGRALWPHLNHHGTLGQGFIDTGPLGPYNPDSANK